MTTAAEVLRSIEASAELATVQELRLLIRHAMSLLPSLDADNQSYANALLLKLDRLAVEQQVDAGPPIEIALAMADLDALLLDEAAARAEASLSGLDRWLRRDVYLATANAELPQRPGGVSAGRDDERCDEEGAATTHAAGVVAMATISRAARQAGVRVTEAVAGDLRGDLRGTLPGEPPVHAAPVQPEPPRPPVSAGLCYGSLARLRWRLVELATHSLRKTFAAAPGRPMRVANVVGPLLSLGPREGLASGAVSSCGCRSWREHADRGCEGRAAASATKGRSRRR